MIIFKKGRAGKIFKSILPALQTIRNLFPLTTLGLVVLVLTLSTIWFFGVRQLDLILLTVSVLIFLLMIIMAFLTPFTAYLTHRRIRKNGKVKAVMLSGQDSPTGFSATSPRWIPFLYLKGSWERPSEAEAELRGKKGDEYVKPFRRGYPDEVVRRFTVEDLLGLTAVSWRYRSACDLRIFPSPARINDQVAIRGIVGGGDLSDPLGKHEGDRVDMRKYGHGDSPRMILWKVYARTRKLFVRIPETAVEEAPRVCAYLVGSVYDEPAASLARTVLEQGLLGSGWRFGADGAKDAETLDDALNSLARSGSYSTTSDSEIRTFLENAERDGFASCLLFLPYREGSWIHEVEEAVSNAGLNVRAAVAVAGWRRGRLNPIWHRILVRSDANEGASPGEIERIMNKLAFPGLTFILADTVSGDVLPDSKAYIKRLASISEAV